MKKIKLTKKLLLLDKTCIVIGTSMMVAVLFLLPILSIICPHIGDAFLIAAAVCLVIFLITGFFVLLFPFFVDDPDGISKVKISVTKQPVYITSFCDFLRRTEFSIAEKGFTKISDTLLEEYEMHLFSAPRNPLKLDLILVIKANELTTEVLNDSNLAYVKMVESYYDKKSTKYQIISKSQQ